MEQNLGPDGRCFVCGEENEQGLKVRFEAAEGRSWARHALCEHHRGYPGMAHGGIVAALLDEAMIYAGASLGRWCVTAELSVRYRNPVPTAELISLRGEVLRRHRRLLECRAEALSATGDLLATATGKLIRTGAPVSPSGRRIRIEDVDTAQAPGREQA